VVGGMVGGKEGWWERVCGSCVCRYVGGGGGCVNWDAGRLQLVEPKRDDGRPWLVEQLEEDRGGRVAAG
jgi:hypothetical protein